MNENIELAYLLEQRDKLQQQVKQLTERIIILRRQIVATSPKAIAKCENEEKRKYDQKRKDALSIEYAIYSLRSGNYAESANHFGMPIERLRINVKGILRKLGKHEGYDGFEEHGYLGTLKDLSQHADWWIIRLEALKKNL